MHDDDFAARLRQLPRRTAPAAWRREILAAAEPVEVSGEKPWRWWHWLCVPTRAGWGALAAVWAVIFWLQSPDETTRPPTADSKPVHLPALLYTRERELLELISPPKPVPPTSMLPGPRRGQLS